MNKVNQYQINKDKWGTFQWYVDSLDYLKLFGISQEDSAKLDEALEQIENILDKFEKI
jgi:hypothetical protein